MHQERPNAEPTEHRSVQLCPILDLRRACVKLDRLHMLAGERGGVKPVKQSVLRLRNKSAFRSND